MRFTTAAAAAAAALATGAAAQKVVSFDLNRGLPGTRIGTPPTLPLSKRDYHGGSIYNNITGGGYYVDVTVGTPGQPITLVLDTGSSDVWFLSYQADLCTSRSLQARYGDSCGTTFNPTKSSSYAVKVRNGFNITYLDGTGATGSYITDDLAINGATIKSLQMGLATSVVRGVGVLGVGFSANEAAATPYPNIIDELATQGLISSRAFSLYLNDRRSDTGTLLFGGVDTSKFVGPLHVLPIPEQTTGYTHYGVVMSSLAATYSNGSTVPLGDTLVGAILDSGTTLSYLPDDVATPLFDQLGVYTDYSGSGYSMVDCGLLDSEPDLVVTFGFGNGQASGGDKFTIAVPVYELVLDLLGGYSELTADAPFDNVCLFGIQSSGGGFGGSDAGAASSGITLLGDTFLRSAYVVYDLDHHQIGMAQANLNATGETKITELDGSGSVLPSFTGVAAQQSGTATATATATTRRTATATTTTSTSASTGTGTSTGGSASSATSGATNTDIGGQSSNTGTPKANAAAPVGGGEGAFAVAVVAGLVVVGGGFVL